MCSGRHCRTTHSERMQGDTEPSQMVSINETWAMFHDGELRIAPNICQPARTGR